MTRGKITVRPAEPGDCVAIQRLANATNSAWCECHGLVADYDGHVLGSVARDGNATIIDPYIPGDPIAAALRRAVARGSVRR
jgi:hypothetical protein